MKIKLDFVTNSSSTCYLVYIPETYSISINEIRTLKEITYYDVEKDEELVVNGEEITDEILSNIMNSLKEIIYDLQSGIGTSFENISENYSSMITNVFREIIEKFTIKTEEMPGGNDTFIIPLRDRDIEEINFIKSEYSG
jgi:hypothetical protein